MHHLSIDFTHECSNWGPRFDYWRVRDRARAAVQPTARVGPRCPAPSRWSKPATNAAGAASGRL